MNNNDTTSITRNPKRLQVCVGVVIAITLAVISGTTVPTFAQEVEEVVTIGVRGQPRSVSDSPAPVDVISGEDFVAQGGIDTSNLLRNSVPSANVGDNPIDDAGTLVRPVFLRGLAPDHTLLLVNGQRRHRSAVITWVSNGMADGAQGPDISAIPALALRSVEVLRDGAAAQYGSDAIAGVINMNLKDSPSEGSVDVKYGEYSEGENKYTIAVNQGFALGDNGFFNVTGEWSEAEDTDRAVQRADAAALVAAGFENVADPVIPWGTPEIDDDIKLWANFGAQLSDKVELFGHANYNDKYVDGTFFYRNPLNRGGVYSNDSGLLIADLTSDGTGGCPTIPVEKFTFGGGSAHRLSTAGTAALAAVKANPDCFHFSEKISGGFTPRFGADVTDTSLLLGLRGETEGGLHWSLSGYYGENQLDFFINNTVNASLGPDTPRNFDPGDYEQQDIAINADFFMTVRDNVNLAFGAEYREEEFTIVAGEEKSYTPGPLGEQGFSTSSNGFAGFSPKIAGSFDRANTSVYVDLEWQVSDALLTTAALRYEDYDDFGNTTNYKLGANWAVSDSFGLRATTSTGFKAPTPGQSNASNISTIFDGKGDLVNEGTIPSTNPVAVAFGGEALQPEESDNLTFGAYFNLGAVDLTIDYFNIEVEDRLSLSDTFKLTDADKITLGEQGIDASDIAEFKYFTNQFDTETEGIDVVATLNTAWANGNTDWSLAYNYTDTSVTKRNSDLFDDKRVREIEDGTPDTRATFTAHHQMNNARFLTRINYYGKFFDGETGGSNFDEAATVDIEVGYRYFDKLNLAVGAQNLFNEKGCSLDECGAGSADGKGVADQGLQHSQYSPYGVNGTFYYGRATYEF